MASKKFKAKKSVTKKTVVKKLAKKVVKKVAVTKKAKAPLKPATRTASKTSSSKASFRPPVSRAPVFKSDRLSPTADGVLVLREEQFEKTAGGLYIPPTAQDKPLRGKVVAVGTGRRNKKGQVRPLDVQVGNDVLFGKYSGTEVKIDGHDFLLLKEPDILGICE